MLILIGFVETVFIFLIGIIMGVLLAYQLFEIDLARKLLNYDLQRTMELIDQVTRK